MSGDPLTGPPHRSSGFSPNMENETPTSNVPSSRQSNDRQTVQVIQQALSRQPSTAAQYLQQMYAAQQQHLMMQTAALQQHQQHLSSAQLQSLAAAQQVSLAVSRAPPTVSQQSPSPVTTINLSSSPQIIQRTSSSAPGITQQAVLLGNASSPALSASQAQMYLRAQMLIFTPAATVSNIQSDVSSASSSSQPPPQNLAVRGAAGETGGPNPSHLPASAVKPPTGSLTKPTNNKKGASPGPDGRPASSMQVITSAPSSRLVPEQKLHQFVLQNHPRPELPLTHQPQVSQGLSSPPITSQAPLAPPSSCAESDRQKVSSILPPQCPAFRTQDGVVQCRLLPPSSAVIFQIPGTRAETPPMQENPSGEPRGHLQPSEPDDAPLTCIAATHDLSQVGHISPHLVDMTSGNGSSPLPAPAPGSSAHNGENKPPQAVVRPQILTHVIEGFVIQEGAQPFPSLRSRAALEVGRSSLGGTQEKSQRDLQMNTTDSEMEEPSVPEVKSDGEPPKLKCELCGRVDFEYKFKRSKRFCSMACAKRYNVGCTKRVGLFHPDRSKVQKPGAVKAPRRRPQKILPDPNKESTKQVPGSDVPSSPAPLSVSSLKHTNSQEDSSRCSDNSSYGEPPSPISASSSHSHHPDMEMRDLHPADPQHVNFSPGEPTKWNVEDVYEFIRSLPGCQDIAEEFRGQEIDGQALLLLKEDHLMSAMNIKLGPALKIFARISMLRDS